jgi:hypothetical protein
VFGRASTLGVAAIDPAWSYEKVIWELAPQQRGRKQVWKGCQPEIERVVTKEAGR